MAKTGWRVEVSGFRQIMDAMDELDKKAARTIRKRITDAGKQVAVNASYMAPGSNPISGWGRWAFKNRDLGYEPGAVSVGFKLRKNNFRRKGISAGLAWDVYQMNPGGAIFEVIGDKSRVSSPRGAQFVDSVNARYPQPKKGPRTLLPAYYSVIDKNFSESVLDDIKSEARRLGLI